MKKSVYNAGAGELFVQALYGRSEVYGHTGRYSSAEDDLERVLKFLRREGFAPKQVAETLLRLADNAFIGKQNHVRAKKLIDDASELIDKKAKRRMLAYSLGLQGNIMQAEGAYDEALELLKKAASIYKRRGCRRDLGRIVSTMGHIFRIRGQRKRALECYQQHLCIGEEENDRMGISMAVNNLGVFYREEGDLKTALLFYERHYETSKQIGYKKGMGVAAGNRGTIYRTMGNNARALECFHENLLIAEEMGDEKGAGSCYGNMAIIRYGMGDRTSALEYFQRYLSISERLSDAKGMGIALGSMGNIYLGDGRYRKALFYYRKYLEIAERLGYKTGIGVACINIGIASTYLEDFEHAWEFLIRAERVFKKTGSPVFLSSVYTSLSECASAEGDYPEAQKYGLKARDIAEEHGAKNQLIYVFRALGKAYINQSKTAIGYLRKSVSLAEKEKLDLERAISLYELALVHEKEGHTKAAVIAVKEACLIFDGSDVAFWQRRAHRALNRIGLKKTNGKV